MENAPGPRDPLLEELSRLRERLAELEARDRTDEGLAGDLRRSHLAVRNLNRLIGAQTDPGQLIDLACDELTTTLGYHAAWIALLDRHGGVTASACSGPEEGFSALIAPDPPADYQGCPVAHSTGERSRLVRLLTCDGTTYGALAVSLPARRSPSDQERSLFCELSEDLARALSRLAVLASLERTRAELSAVYEHAPVMMCLVDKDRRVLYANRAFTEFTGVSEALLREGVACGVFGCINALEDPRGCGFGPDCQECQLRLALADTLETGQRHSNVEYRATLALPHGRKEVVLLGSTARITAAGKHNLLLCLEDATERIQAEEQRRNLEQRIFQSQKLESLAVMAGGIAHDFNNLLMIILGRAELLRGEGSSMSVVREGVHEIEIAARRAAELCRQLMAYTGQAPLMGEETDLGAVIEEMAQLLRAALSRQAALSLTLEPGLPSIHADPTQIRQILMNLILNASEAIGDHGGEIRISARAARIEAGELEGSGRIMRPSPGLHVLLEVADTGCGMDSKTLDRIFEPFFSTKFAGRGLGLAAVQGIIRAHAGGLEVESRPGEGTTFRILLPALAERTGSPDQPEKGAAAWHGKGTILLVDDEESLRSLGTAMLGRLGFEVLTAADGTEAVELYRERGAEIQLVILDLTMPRMDGIHTLNELRKIDPALRIILASGYSEEDVAPLFAGKDLSGTLQKPYTLAKLKGVIATLTPKGQTPGPLPRPS